MFNESLSYPDVFSHQMKRTYSISTTLIYNIEDIDCDDKNPSL
jgi:hypothetical protein